jgi:hypothetical protein
VVVVAELLDDELAAEVAALTIAVCASAGDSARQRSH